MLKSQYVEIAGSKMHYVEAGSGEPILFLHGIPTSSYLWRNIMPHLASLGHCIAPDLIGFGRSEKPDIEYSVFEHISYIEKFINALNLKNITIVMHGWGSVIGFDYAMRNENNCKGLVFYEAFLRSLNGNDFSLPFQEQLAAFNVDANATDIVMNGAAFIDKIIPQHSIRDLSDDEMYHYRQPFLPQGTGKPIVQYLKELPKVGNGESKIGDLIAEYTKKLTQSQLPKLLLYSVPGFVTTIATIIWAKANFPHLEIIEVGEELHLATESNPKLISETISVWLQGIETKRS